MALIIFFHGILLGGLLGFAAMALLSVIRSWLRCRVLEEVPVLPAVYPRINGIKSPLQSNLLLAAASVATEVSGTEMTGPQLMV